MEGDKTKGRALKGQEVATQVSCAKTRPRYFLQETGFRVHFLEKALAVDELVIRQRQDVAESAAISSAGERHGLIWGSAGNGHGVAGPSGWPHGVPQAGSGTYL